MIPLAKISRSPSPSKSCHASVEALAVPGTSTPGEKPAGPRFSRRIPALIDNTDRSRSPSPSQSPPSTHLIPVVPGCSGNRSSTTNPEPVFRSTRLVYGNPVSPTTRSGSPSPSTSTMPLSQNLVRIHSGGGGAMTPPSFRLIVIQEPTRNFSLSMIRSRSPSPSMSAQRLMRMVLPGSPGRSIRCHALLKVMIAPVATPTAFSATIR